MSNFQEDQGLFHETNQQPARNGLHDRLQADIQAAGGEVVEDAELAGAIGDTMFDLPGSEDLTVTVLLRREKLHHAPSQSLVRIKSRRGGDGRCYLGIVSAGPFSNQDLALSTERCCFGPSYAQAS